MTRTEDGRLVVVAGPQGIGKSYAVTRLVQGFRRVTIAEGVVTRPPREELDASDRHVDTETFRRMECRGELCLTKSLWGYQYGYSRRMITQSMENGLTVFLLLLDPEEVLEARSLFPGATLVLLCPRAWEIVEERLSAREGLDEAGIVRKMENNKRILPALEALPWSLVVTVDEKTNAALEIARHLSLAIR